MKVDAKTIDRFFSKIDMPKDANRCWRWSGHKSYSGYGRFRLGGKIKKAHRVSWELLRGEIPKGYQILHACDNPECCNPLHLSTGTHEDNMRDKALKGRVRVDAIRGEMNGMSKLTKEKVLAIRDLCSSGFSQYLIADRFGMSQGVISKIARKESWTHI